ncbi:hypothetical protein [Paenibacillus methanolicus]|uniref:hypothetical protein n=1 Tax=Paenibacillus methanolicus TaxID=582686 RepID=UPI001FE64F1E|nr:hypothetical protein [Paenibacillus methanolicus]
MPAAQVTQYTIHGSHKPDMEQRRLLMPQVKEQAEQLLRLMEPYARVSGKGAVGGGQIRQPDSRAGRVRERQLFY